MQLSRAGLFGQDREDHALALLVVENWLKASIQKRDPLPGSGVRDIWRISGKGGLYFLSTDQPGENPGGDPSELQKCFG